MKRPPPLAVKPLRPSTLGRRVLVVVWALTVASVALAQPDAPKKPDAAPSSLEGKIIIRIPDGGIPTGSTVTIVPVTEPKAPQAGPDEQPDHEPEPEPQDPTEAPQPNGVDVKAAEVPTTKANGHPPSGQSDPKAGKASPDAEVPTAAEGVAQHEGPKAPSDEDGGSAAAAVENQLPPLFPATYHGQVSPLGFRAAAQGHKPEERAREATSALESALDHGEKEDLEVTVRIEADVAVVRIGPHVVGSLYQSDADIEGLPLPTYAAQVGTELTGFVPTQLTRRAIQLFALHVFLSVFAIVLAFVALRELRKLFDRWDESLDARRGTLGSISLLRIPVISAEALGGALAFGLAVGRVVAYIITVAAAIATVLSQFESTRPLLKRLGKASTQPFVDGLEAVIGAVPGLVLTAVLLLGLRAGMRVLNLLLDGVASKQIVWRFLPASRVPLFRTLAPVVATLLLAPLLVAAAFGQYGTPLEVLAVGAGGVVLIASIPLCATWVVGVVTMWTNHVQPGDWIQLGKYSGEVTTLSVGEIRLVPEEGGTVAVPMLCLLLFPLRRFRGSPAVQLSLAVVRDRPAKELVTAVRDAVRRKETEASVEVIDVDDRALYLQVNAPSLRTGIREMLLIAISDAADEGLITLRPSRRGGPRLEVNDDSEDAGEAGVDNDGDTVDEQGHNLGS